MDLKKNKFCLQSSSCSRRSPAFEPQQHVWVFHPSKLSTRLRNVPLWVEGCGLLFPWRHIHVLIPIQHSTVHQFVSWWSHTANTTSTVKYILPRGELPQATTLPTHNYIRGWHHNDHMQWSRANGRKQDDISNLVDKEAGDSGHDPINSGDNELGRWVLTTEYWQQSMRQRDSESGWVPTVRE